MSTYQILARQELISHGLNGRLMSLIEKNLCALSFNYKFFTSAFVGAGLPDNNLNKKEEEDSKDQTERERVETWPRAKAQVGSEEVWLIHWDCLFPCESCPAQGPTCKGTSLIASGL